MSRSRKKPIIRDSPRNEKTGMRYNRSIRRVIKNKVKYLNEELEDKILPDPKTIVNDYDRSDYRIDYRLRDNEEMSKKESRK